MNSAIARVRRLTRRIGSTTRTVALLVVLVGAGFVTAAYFTVARTHDQLMDQVDDRLIEDTQAVSSALSDAQDRNDVVNIGQALGGRQALIVLGPTGTVLASSPSGDLGRPDPLPPLPPVEQVANRLGTPFDAGGGELPEYRAAAAALPDGEYLVVASPLAPTDRIMHDLGRSLQLVGTVVLAILGLFIWAVIRSANRQIDQMIDVATAVGSGDLSARLDDSVGATEAARLAHALNAMTAQLQATSTAREESDERLRRFVADASHELHTPLATIRGYAQLHRAGALTEPDDADRAMSRIESEAGRMTRLVEEMLLLARLDQGRPLRSDEVDITKIVADAVDDARARDPTRQIDLLLPPNPVTVTGDEERLHQVIENLLENARAHTPARTPVRVEVNTDSQTEIVTIVLADDGPGMTPAHAARAFDRFYRAEASRSRQHGGTGLGLAIVASIVEAHHGNVTLVTQPGNGATFVIQLPHGDDPRAHP
jgi:two-component system, OmpR family, sensor kinase